MWKSVVGHNVSLKVAEGDDWETDPDFENDVSEQEQRWGAKTIEGSGRKEHISVSELRQKVSQEHEVGKQKERAEAPKASYGYGGKFGVEKDRMDKGAVGHGYVAQVEQHSSQTDAKRGFGGKFGVQKDRVDKSAMGFEYKGEVEQHTSQKDYSKGFGGKFGVEKEKVDKAALGYDYKGETEKHESQKDYAKGFGGRHGVQTDRMDKSAVAFTDMESPTSAYEKTIPLEASSAGAGNLKARFENLARSSDEENRKRAEEERARRQAREKREQEEAQRIQQPPPVEEQRPPPVPETNRKPQPPQLPTARAVPQIPRDEPELVEEEEEPDYDQPPCLPPRSSDLLEAEPPQEQTPSEPEQEDEGEYEDISPIPFFPEPVPEADDEISFNPDDVITNIEMVDEGWWKGHCHGRIGLFPATFVKMM
uniref:Hematopoietic cell-specific Lyn substrate 1 n=1 Tax=Oncorhynchus mykiss TaxID=8022 RepID=A0A8C7Q0Y4_ONCMY